MRQRDSSSGGDGSSLVTRPVDTSKTARRGGTNKWYLNADPANFDVHVGGVPKNNPKNLVYSNLVSAKPGYMKEPDFAGVHTGYRQVVGVVARCSR